MIGIVVGLAVYGLVEHYLWPERAESALRARLSEHDSGRRDHSRLLWSLLVLEHWRRRHGVAEDLA